MPPESDFRDTYGYMCSFLHEAGHATGAPGRLGRGFGSTREEYAIEELRAEIASAMTSQQLGIPLTEEQMQSNLDLHKAYIQSWAQAIKDAPRYSLTPLRTPSRSAITSSIRANSGR